MRRLPGSRSIRDLIISSGKGPFQRLHRTFRRLRQKKATANEQDFQVEEEVMESAVMEAEETVQQKPREVSITEDTESIELGWFENTKLNRVKIGTRCLLQVGVRDWESLGTSPSMIQKGFCETVAEVMNAEAGGKYEIHPSKRPRVAERVPIHVPPEVEPRDRDSNVNEFLRSGRNSVLASVFGDSEMIRRAAVRRGYPVMKSGF